MGSPCSLGIVIPCHKPYLRFLKDCLDSIENQTVKPSRVIVVCSESSRLDIPDDAATYSFPLTMIMREGVHNQSENRNHGASMIGTDYISFFDADDVMHPQRIQWIRHCLPFSDMIVHSYTMQTPYVFRPIDVPTMYLNAIIEAPSGCLIFEPELYAPIHHSQVTVRGSLFGKVRFDERPEVVRREDCIFCCDILRQPGVECAYIADPLSWYRLTH